MSRPPELTVPRGRGERVPCPEPADVRMTHGWGVTLDTDYENGVRIVISTATVAGLLEN